MSKATTRRVLKPKQRRNSRVIDPCRRSPFDTARNDPVRCLPEQSISARAWSNDGHLLETWAIWTDTLTDFAIKFPNRHTAQGGF